MSSLKNAAPQRPYRERDQPRARSRYGLLEKHKDYSARAQDYNAKKARLKRLRQKAADKNEDEFHFGMMSSQTKDGVKIAGRGNKVLSNEAVKLLKTQDAGYLRTVRLRTTRELERMEDEVQILHNKSNGLQKIRSLRKHNGAAVDSTRTVFVDDEADQQIFDPEVWLKHQVESTSKLQGGNESEVEAERERAQQKMLAKLEALRTRERELIEAERELEMQRAKMNNTTGGVNKQGVKFKLRERKR